MKYDKLKGPALPVKKKLKKQFQKKIRIFLAYNIPRPPMSVHTKFQLNRSSRLASNRQHIYIYDVLFYYIDNKTLKTPVRLKNRANFQSAKVNCTLYSVQLYSHVSDLQFNVSKSAKFSCISKCTKKQAMQIDQHYEYFPSKFTT